jgi:lysozyme
MKFEVIDRCPVPAVIAAQVRLLQADVAKATGRHPTLQSAYRGDLAAGILKRLGKSTQAMLYWGFVHHLRGFNPANPPGFSTHELHSDAVAYKGPRGRLILAWGCGLDFDDWAIPHLIAAARKRGWDLFQPYHTGSEFHHLNFRKRPRIEAKPKPVAPVKPPLLGVRRVSAAGVHLISDFEGGQGRDGLFHAYQDAVKVWTIGYGHTVGVSAGSRPLTKAQAQQLLRRDLNRVYAPPVRKAAKAIGLKLTQNEFDALVSAVYNLGPGILDRGRTLGDALRSKDRHRIADAFLVYDKAGTPPRPLAGLTRRRKAEKALFLKP